MSQSTSTSSTSSRDDQARLLSSLFIPIKSDQSGSSHSTPCISPGTSDKSSPSITCFKCDRSPSTRCLDCNILICDQCVMTCLLREHSVIPVQATSPLGSASSDSDMVIYCEVHGEPLRFYCKTCSFCICLNCTIWSHKEHRYILIKGNNKSVINIILDIQNTKAPIDTIQAALCKVDDIRKTYEKESEEVIMKIKHEMHSITQVIRKREKSLLEKLYWTGQAKYNEVAKQTNSLREMLAKLSNFGESLDSCKNSNNLDIFVNREKCKAYLESTKPEMDITEEKIVVIAPNYNLVEHMRQQCDVVSVPINQKFKLSNLQPTLISPVSSISSFGPSNFGSLSE